jgi:hypothetical protein
LSGDSTFEESAPLVCKTVVPGLNRSGENVNRILDLIVWRGDDYEVSSAKFVDIFCDQPLNWNV